MELPAWIPTEPPPSLVPRLDSITTALQAGEGSPMLSLFGVSTRQTRRGVIMEQQCPVFVMQLPGERLGTLPRGQKRIASTDEPAKLQVAGPERPGLRHG